MMTIQKSVIRSQIFKSFSLGVSLTATLTAVWAGTQYCIHNPGLSLWLLMMSLVQNGCFCIHVLYNRRKCSCCSIFNFSCFCFYLVILFSPSLLYHIRYTDTLCPACWLADDLFAKLSAIGYLDRNTGWMVSWYMEGWAVSVLSAMLTSEWRP